MSAPADTASPRPSTFSSLRTRNFRLFLTGQVFSYTGSWVQRVAQDWLVLTLTGSATAVGVTTALQFVPTLLFGMYGGVIADRYPKRLVLFATQIGMAAMAAVLAVLTLSHQVHAWHVYLIAFGLGLVTAVDNPTRQSFVNEMVGPEQLRNAISINSSVFQLGALVGPALSGLLVNAVGAGWAFTINAASYVAPMIALAMLRPAELHARPGVRAEPGQVRAAVDYVRRRPDVLWPTVIVGVLGLFTISLPVTLAAYAKSVFDSGPGGYGLLNCVVAVGALVGALYSARRTSIRLRSIIGTAAILAALLTVAALVPGQAAFCLLLVAIGAASLILVTAANSTVQLATPDAIRGRVMGIYVLVFIGSGAVGGPLIGWIDEAFGPRVGLLLSGLVSAAATGLIAARLARTGGLRLRFRPSEGMSGLIAVVSR